MEADNDDFPYLEDSPYRLHDDNDLYVHLEDVLPAGMNLNHHSQHSYQALLSAYYMLHWLI